MPIPKCGGLGILIAIVIAVVATVLTAGAFAVAAGAAGGFFSAGVAALGAGITGGLAAGATIGATIGTFAVAGAVGSIASQGVLIAAGEQEKFSWKGVALGAVGSVVGGSLSQIPGLAGAGFGYTVARAAVGSVITQGVGVAAGLQKSFSWRSVAASAVGAGVAYGISQAIGEAQWGGDWKEGANVVKQAVTDPWGTAFRSLASGVLAGAASSIVQSGRVNWNSVVQTAVGSTIGEAVQAEARSSIAEERATSANEDRRDRDMAEILRNAGIRQTAQGLTSASSNSDSSSLLDISSRLQQFAESSGPGSNVLDEFVPSSRMPGMMKVGFGSGGGSEDAASTREKASKSLGQVFEGLIDQIAANGTSAIEKVARLAEQSREGLGQYIRAFSENLPALAKAAGEDFKTAKPEIIRDAVISAGLVVFDILNTPVSPTPDTSILALGVIANRLGKGVTYTQDIVRLREVLGEKGLTGIALSAAQKAFDNLDVKLGPGTKLATEALEAGVKLAFKGIDMSLDRISGTHRLIKVIGETVMKAGDLGELVTSTVFKASGLFDNATMGALQNKSNQGVDLFAKGRNGKWYAYEIKSSYDGEAGGLKGDQRLGAAKYASLRVATALVGEGRWTKWNQNEDMRKWVGTISDETNNFRRNFDGYVVRNNYFGDSKNVNVEIKPWSTPTPLIRKK